MAFYSKTKGKSRIKCRCEAPLFFADMGTNSANGWSPSTARVAGPTGRRVCSSSCAGRVCTAGGSGWRA